MPILPALEPLFRTIAGNGDRQPSDLPLREARDVAHAAMERFVTRFYAPVDPLPGEEDCSVPVAGGHITVRGAVSLIATRLRSTH